MLTKILLSLIAVLAASCLGGGATTEPSPSPTPAATEAPRTATPTPTPPPTATPIGRAVLAGSAFRGEGPANWLLVPGSGLTPRGAERERIDGLPRGLRLQLERVVSEAEADVIFMGLPDSLLPRILVPQICEGTWALGPGDWTRTMLGGFEATGVDVEEAKRRVALDGVPYPLYEVDSPDGLSYDVYPVSRDGCTYAFSLRGEEDDTTLAAYMDFLRTLELGRRQAGEVPAGWKQINGRRFTAYAPPEWFYNDLTTPLSDTQIAEINALPSAVSARIWGQQGELDTIEILYPGLPDESDSVLTVLGQCWSTSQNQYGWAEYMRSKRAEQGRDPATNGFRVPIDGTVFEIFEVRYREDLSRIDYEVYPVGENDCTYLFSYHPSPHEATVISDFVAFLETVDLLDVP